MSKSNECFNHLDTYKKLCENGYSVDKSGVVTILNSKLGGNKNES